MAAPIAEKISGASEGSPARTVGTTPDPDTEGTERGFFQSMPVVDASVQEKARMAEDQLLTLIRTPIFREEVELNSRGIYIHTLRTRVPSCAPPNPVPLLLVHGMGNGLGTWALNMDELAQNRQVFAIDLLGFGRSSRFEFGDDPRTVEQQYVQSMEEWREKKGLKQFILCGHSMGGYVSCAYALRYPERVAHLILDDPWGFTESTKLAHKIGSFFVLQTMPYFRAPKLIRETAMVFLNRAFKAFDKCHGGAGLYYKDYVLAMNQAVPPTGEKAFSTLALWFGLRAKTPMLSRLADMDARVGVSFLIGERSFLPYNYIYELAHRGAQLRLNMKLIQGADHELHVTQSHQFNDVVNTICDRVDDLTPFS